MKTCHYYLESLSKKDDPNYLFLRYEDMSRDLLSTAKHVYDFIQQPMSKELLKWTHESELNHANKKMRIVSLGKYRRPGSESVSDPYSTKRNSKLTMTAWRQKISFKEVTIVLL